MAEGLNKSQNEHNDQFGLPTEKLTPIESKRNKRWVKTTVIIAGIALLAGTGVIAWLFYPSETISYLLKSSENKYIEEADKTLMLEEANTIPSDPLPAPPATTQTIPTVESPTGMWYIIINSYIDIALATDEGKNLMSEGLDVKLILPTKDQPYARLSIAEAPSLEEARNIAGKLKTQLGKLPWISKY